MNLIRLLSLCLGFACAVDASSLLAANSAASNQIAAGQYAAKAGPGPVKPSSAATSRPVAFAGIITDQAGMPLPGATVWVTGTPQLVAVTNVLGEFVLLLPNNSPVQLSCGFIGFQQENVAVARPRAKKDFYISMQPSPTAHR